MAHPRRATRRTVQTSSSELTPIKITHTHTHQTSFIRMMISPCRINIYYTQYYIMSTLTIAGPVYWVSNRDECSLLHFSAGRGRLRTRCRLRNRKPHLVRYCELDSSEMGASMCKRSAPPFVMCDLGIEIHQNISLTSHTLNRRSPSRVFKR